VVKVVGAVRRLRGRLVDGIKDGKKPWPNGQKISYIIYVVGLLTFPFKDIVTEHQSKTRQ